MNYFWGNTISMAERSLDFLWQKQQVISNNIANVDTPGYKAQYVTFEDTFSSRLKAAANSGNSESVQEAISGASSQVHKTGNESARADGNNVNLDTENVELTRTALQYQYLLSTINNDITRYRTVIKGQ